MLSKTKVLIFDFDGTVSISEPVHALAWRDVGVDYKRPLPEGFVEAGIGHTDAELSVILSMAWQLEGEANLILRQKRAHYQERAKTGSGLNPGIRESLAHFAPTYQIGMATAACHADVGPTLSRFGIRDYFKILVAIEDVSRPKPHPECYLKIADFFGVRPIECLVFEDTLIGGNAARAAGMPVVGVTTSYGPTELGQIVGAIPDFSNIPIIENIIQSL